MISKQLPNGISAEDRGRNRRFQEEFVRAHPPLVRFAPSVRDEASADASVVNHFEFMMALIEVHPIIPLEVCSFGSDLLDARRALAYHIMIRQLGHARSLVVNANIRNRVGVGASLRWHVGDVRICSVLQPPRQAERLPIDRGLSSRTILCTRRMV
jgi:hypothetical protein